MDASDDGSPADPERPRLSRQSIADAALQMIDEQGVATASLRGVAARLGYEPMSLYRYVSNRDDLFDAVVDRVVDELDHDPEVEATPVHGWQDYLARLAHGVRRYARGHPHAFPMVATRPSQAPWINPPLRSLRWIESMITALSDEGFSDDQVLFVYRSFNSFLLGFLLLETSAMTLVDPKPGDGALSASAGGDAAAVETALPGGLTPSRTAAEREAIADAETPHEQLDPLGGNVPEDEYPGVHRLAAGLAADVWSEEFDAGLEELIDRIGRFSGVSG
ncbi:TetR/AcrR family transcriptional regulator [Jatrophihabitans sp. YIM 134969]